MYHDLYLGRKALVKRENMGLDLTKSDLCPSFVKDLTAKGMGLHVVDSHTGLLCFSLDDYIVDICFEVDTDLSYELLVYQCLI
ncbi:hypothetical protein Tco_0920539, partial [Tanacetum coccineum]